MNVLFLILFVVAGIMFGLAAANSTSKYNLMALGLLAWVLVPLIQTVDKLA